MPTYSYACRDCEHRFDIQQAFTDDALTVCPECGGGLRKVFSAVGVVFKGSGFYRTDSRSSGSSGSATSTTSAGSGGGSADGAGSSGSSTSGSSKSGSSTPSTSGSGSSSTGSSTPTKDG
ncbi:FmdB family zinc ribbon protein [Ornithinimicrobium sediminis]|uniref:FmdB family zinc ribbon protein n=1 Tax=Ornithinimicrobium sediminis TaxID=2904603 RepID=UPI001E64A4CB|nr:FmdB family transcriptional regulator [Ornithinimicrobium sediminis]